MPRRSHWILGAAALLSCTTLAGCGSGGDHSSPGPSGSPSASDASSTPTTAAPGPATAAATTQLLHWTTISGDTNGTLLSNGTWTLSVPENGSTYQLTQPGAGNSGTAPAGFKVSDTLLDERWAVVVLQDKQQRRPEQATIVDLTHHDRTWQLDGSTSIPTTTGGSWALSGDTLIHATVSQKAYCEARVDLASRTSELGWCAPARHGWNSPIIGPGGEAMLTFDDGQPSCRTVVSVRGRATTPFDGVPDCKGAQGALLDGSTVWSVVPNEHQFEQVRMQARGTAGGTGDTADTDLGPGVNGTLTVCGGSAYWARDPATDNGPAQLMRWDGHRLTVAYESRRGNAFLGQPSCAGSVLNVSSYSDHGDEAVYARVD